MRADGKRVRNADPLYMIVPHIMDKRYDAMNMITLDIPVEPLHHYINAKRQEGYAISHMGLLIAAYLRAAAEFPLLNRFIVNKKIYDRNEFCVSFVVLRSGAEEEATMSKVYFDLSDTVFDVQKKIDAYIAVNQHAGVNNQTDRAVRILLGIPGLLRFGIVLAKWVDRHFGLPRAVIKASPFHTSLTISNLASIRTNHIYHHTYEFGTTSVFITMGNLREVPMRKKDGIKIERCLPLGVVMDERICSGTYFANAFSRIKRYLNNPALLEQKYKCYPMPK